MDIHVPTHVHVNVHVQKEKGGLIKGLKMTEYLLTLFCDTLHYRPFKQQGVSLYKQSEV